MTAPCPTCGNTHPDGSTHSGGVSQTVPRVASSLEDLRAGMWVAIRNDSTGVCFSGELVSEGAGTDRLRLRWDNLWFYPFIERGIRSYTVLILSDPPPEPVTVSREAFDRLARTVGRDEPMKANAQTAMVDAMWHDEFVDAARALVDEVRATP